MCSLFLWFTLLLSTQLSPITNLTWNFFLYITSVETPSAWRIADRRYVILTFGGTHTPRGFPSQSKHMHTAIWIRNRDPSAKTAQDVKNTGKYVIPYHVKLGTAIFMATFYGEGGGPETSGPVCNFLMKFVRFFSRVSSLPYRQFVPSPSQWFHLNVLTVAMISGSLSPRYGASSVCGWRNGLQYRG